MVQYRRLFKRPSAQPVTICRVRLQRPTIAEVFPLMRYTVVDSLGTISFHGPGHGLKMVAAACSQGAQTHRDLLNVLDGLDGSLASTVRSGLSAFDEHCLSGDPETVQRWVASKPSLNEATFRVLDETTRSASLQPGKLGLVIFNLGTRKIVQVQNSYAALTRTGRGRVRRDNRPTRHYYRYELPGEWHIVP